MRKGTRLTALLWSLLTEASAPNCPIQLLLGPFQEASPSTLPSGLPDHDKISTCHHKEDHT